MNQLYKRIPKNWWQRVWFRVRPQITTEEEARLKFTFSMKKKYGYEAVLDFPEWFEANYEPVGFDNKWHKKIIKSNADASKIVKRYERDCPPGVKLTREEEFELMRQHIKTSGSGL